MERWSNSRRAFFGGVGSSGFTLFIVPPRSGGRHSAAGITAYLRRERDALKGCPVADVMADPELRRPVEETFAWLTDRLAGLLAEGHANDELDAGLDSAATATALVAVLQGGYVLAAPPHCQND